MRRALIGLLGLVLIAGCSSRKSSLLLERQTRGAFEEEQRVAHAVAWNLQPAEQALTKEDVDVTVRYTPQEFLNDLFSRPDLFGAYAGKKKNPFYSENMVFYVRITNHSAKKIRINPAEFVMIDDRGNQFATIGVDYVTAFGEAKRPVASTTRGMVESASPGYFGFSLPIGKMVAGKPQGQFALLQQSLLQPGYMYPGVVYDGLIAFWNPPRDAKKMRVLLTNIKTGFDAKDVPGDSLEFPFEFSSAAPR